MGGYPCCCRNCKIFEDNFDRADSSDPGSDWTEWSGTGGISGGAYVFTSAGAIACNTVHPDGDSSMAVECNVSHDTNGSACDLIVAAVDSSNYFYARYTFNSGATGSIAIRRNNGGSHSTVVSVGSKTITTNTTYLVRVCINENGDITASLNGLRMLTASSQLVSGSSCGVGCSGSGTASISDFKFSKIHHSENADNCPKCAPVIACPHCDNGVAPRQIQVTVPPGTFTTGTCNDNDCLDVVNGSVFIIDFIQGNSTWCIWQLHHSEDFNVCNLTLGTIFIRVVFWNFDLVDVVFFSPGSGSETTFRRDQATPFDCSISEYIVPWNNNAGLARCDSTDGKYVIINAL